ncbi:MAG: hypothetical protein Q8Q09_14250 [Deltaproteobacteria bacterium]|nr:hypothetical protein [Deltaproteobacteria bacterium]
MKIKFALGLVVSIFGYYGGCAPPIEPPACVSFSFVESGNQVAVRDAYLDVESGPESTRQRAYSHGSNSIGMHAFCRGTHVLVFGHTDFLPTRLTYTSPRDRDLRGNDFTDQVTVTLTPR